MAQPLDLSRPTALVLIDNQFAFTNPATVSHWGSSRSNPHYEANLQSLLHHFRTARATSPSASKNLHIIHVFHASDSPTSPLHQEHPSGGIQPLDFAIPAADGSEPVFWKDVNSAFIGTELESHLRKLNIRQIVFAGLTTDHCVSTTVRMAANLRIVDILWGTDLTYRQKGDHIHDFELVDAKGEQDDGRIILAADATATFAKGGFDAETVHQVSVASLEGEFADVLRTEMIVEALENYGKA
ncbi:hypothetical protein N7539_000564 [Penicillium diatomitis]|uniref:Isochorismatase-like domain-containing protein n=1 Tax=Penicillium diatomitis TaxID=2819901 RepID=A0A9W9XM62_9EURO|nr:uncharacterized protein N7539_000564 [Penicillium diatomitis]KAJ5495448.1 hypothetical protein N7539_000564 [Penicillium diatomitis]